MLAVQQHRTSKNLYDLGVHPRGKGRGRLVSIFGPFGVHPYLDEFVGCEGVIESACERVGEAILADLNDGIEGVP